MSARNANASVIWKHRDTAPQVTMEQAFDLAKRRAWGEVDSNTACACVRALLVAGLWEAAQLGARPAKPRSAEDLGLLLGDLDARAYPRPVELFAASTIARTPQLLFPPGKRTVFSFVSEDGAAGSLELPAVEYEETGLPPLILGLVYVVAIVASAVAAIFVAHDVANVVDRAKARDGDTAKLLSSQAKALELIDAHNARKGADGAPVPWTKEELAALDGLLGAQLAIAKKQERPLPEPFPGASTGLGGVGAAIKDAGEGLVLGALALGAISVLSK